MAKPINLDQAAAIISAAFHGFINQPPLPNNEKEARPIKIGGVLKGLSKPMRIRIYELIRKDITSNGCQTVLAAEPFINATYDTVGNIIDDIDESTTCP